MATEALRELTLPSTQSIALTSRFPWHRLAALRIYGNGINSEETTPPPPPPPPPTHTHTHTFFFFSLLFSNDQEFMKNNRTKNASFTMMNVN